MEYCGLNIWFEPRSFPGLDFINAYVDIVGSGSLSDEQCGCPAYRSGDTLGVDTSHDWNRDQSLAEKRLDAINQIKDVVDTTLASLAK